MGESASKEVQVIQHAILDVRGQAIILDSDLAKLFGVSTGHLNEQVKRNQDRFGPAYSFQLTAKEFSVLKSRSAITKSGRGGRRYSPWAYTEYGVVMAATVVNSPQAIAASKLIVEVFVEVRHRFQAGVPTLGIAGPPIETGAGAMERLARPQTKLSGKLQAMMERLLDTVIDTEAQSTVRDEVNTLVAESLRNLKARLGRAGIENEEIAARTAKLLAEAETERSIAAKNRAEANAIEFATFVRKLQLLIEADRAISQQNTDAFLRLLGDLGRPV
jgi:hypothetical protein